MRSWSHFSVDLVIIDWCLVSMLKLLRLLIEILSIASNCTDFDRLFQGHSSFITHLDWSADNQLLRSNSGDYELLFCECLNFFLKIPYIYFLPTGQADVCRQITQSSSLRDTEWATNTCTLTFQTVGIWPEGVDGTDVNHSARSSDCSLLVTADDFGKVKLYSYPVCQPKVRNFFLHLWSLTFFLIEFVSCYGRAFVSRNARRVPSRRFEDCINWRQGYERYAVAIVLEWVIY